MRPMRKPFRVRKELMDDDPPDLTEVRKGTERIVEAAALASEIINRLRSLYKMSPPQTGVRLDQ